MDHPSCRRGSGNSTDDLVSRGAAELVEEGFLYDGRGRCRADIQFFELGGVGSVEVEGVKPGRADAGFKEVGIWLCAGRESSRGGLPVQTSNVGLKGA
jgi:hypothetical protein